MRAATRIAAISVLALAAAPSCVGPRRTGAGVGPDQMSAAGHREAAHRSDEIARQGPYLTRRSWAPWTYSWDAGTEHLAERDAHLAAAELLVARYREACGDLPIAAQSSSPLARHARAVTATDGGVMLAIDPVIGSPEDLLAAIRCHRAWLALADRPGPTEDIIALDHLHYAVELRDEALWLSVTTTTPGELDELRRRAEAAVARSQSSAPAP